jgi:hypothetical protein
MNNMIRNYRLTFGKHKGQTLDQIASTPEGLKYLDWLVDWFTLDPDVKKILLSFLSDPNVKLDLERTFDE